MELTLLMHLQRSELCAGKLFVSVYRINVRSTMNVITVLELYNKLC